MSSSWFWRTVVFTGVLVASTGSTAFASTGSTSATLSARLLPAKALGPGWSVQSSTGFTKGSPACVAQLYAKATHQSGVARRTFASSTGRSAFQDRLVSFADNAAVARTSALEKSVATCPSKSGGVSMSVHKLPFVAVGEQSAAYQVQFVLAGGQKVSGVFGIARQGTTVIVAAHSQQGVATTAGTDQGKQFATLAIKNAA